MPAQVLAVSPVLLFEVDVAQRRIYEDLTLHVTIDSNVVAAAHPEVVSYSTTLFDPRPQSEWGVGGAG